jgi:enoyl-CoA hydratase
MMENVGTWVEDGMAWVEIRRPEKLNALRRATMEDLGSALVPLTVDPAVRVILLTGAGERAFAAGADVREMSSLDGSGIRSLMELGKEITRQIEEAIQPVVAVVNGFALGGGCELVLACDLVVASETARFGLPEVDLGILTGWGGSQRLERRVGYGRARDMLLTGRHVPAATALEWGLCDRVVPPDQLRAEATALARSLAAKDPAAVSAAKRALRLRAVLPLAEGLVHETELFVDLFDRPERVAAMERFLSRR